MENPSHRRTFLKSSALGLLPMLVHSSGISRLSENSFKQQPERPVNFITAGEMLGPRDYINRLDKIYTTSNIEEDTFGEGGCVAALEKKFEALTGMEKAVFVPTGTMANQLAIALLSADKAKVFVQETSHLYRDEADAAQTVHGKRLIPLAQGRPYFTVAELQEQINYYSAGEIFKSGIGAVSLETPVRRCDNRMIPLNELEKISAYCREKNIPLHIDGARIFMSATWSDSTVAQYAALADTLYVSLYKYLGASSGAILCGKKALIDKVPHLIKIYGGSMFRNWTNAAVALDHLDGFAERLQAARKKGEELIAMLNRIKGINISPYPEGTNMYKMMLDVADKKAYRSALLAKGIRAGFSQFSINETVLYRSNEDIFKAFKTAMGKA